MTDLERRVERLEGATNGKPVYAVAVRATNETTEARHREASRRASRGTGECRCHRVRVGLFHRGARPHPMTNLARRIVQLEQERIGTGRIFVIKGPDGYDIGQAKSELGIQASNDDLVVYLREFSSDNSAAIRPARRADAVGGPVGRERI